MTRDDRKVAFLLGGFGFLALAGLGHHTWGTVDAIERLAVTRSVLTSGSVITPEFGPVKYGPLQSVLMLPTYALGYGIGALTKAGDPDRVGYRVTAFLFTPLLVSFLLALWYGSARRWGFTPPIAAAGAWTLLWCTLVMPYSRLMFSDLLSATMLFAGATCLLVPAEESPRSAGFFYLGAAALNYAIFLPLLFVAAVAAPFREWRRSRPSLARRTAVVASSSLALTIACWVTYNLARYGIATQFGYMGEGFSTPVLRGLYGLLASPGRGLIYYSLPTAVALVFSIRSVSEGRSPHRSRVALTLAAFLSYLVLYAHWGSFEGGWCWGPRFLLPFVPLLHLALLPMVSRRRLLFAAVSFAGFLVNAWEYSTEWQAYEKATFGDGRIDYVRSIFELQSVSALHGFAGSATVGRFLQFLGVAALTSWLLVAAGRRAARTS